MDVSQKTTFLPSEVARLVLGYLKEQLCAKAAEYFLRDSVHLGEYRSMLDQGFQAPLSIGGRTLVEVLCLCNIDDSTAGEGKEKAELWSKLDHILSQLKSFKASVDPQPSQFPPTRNKLCRPVRIRQSSDSIKATIKKCDSKTNSCTSQSAAISGEALLRSHSPVLARSPPRAKKHVTWKQPVEAGPATPKVDTDSHSKVTVISKVPQGSDEVSDDQGTIDDGMSADYTESHEPISEVTIADSSEDSLGAASNLTIAESTDTELGTQSKQAALRLPGEQYDWSPYKSMSKSADNMDDSEKTDIDQEVSDLLNDLFPMKNVVDKLVEDDAWAQDMARSINERKDCQSHLAEEKIPQVLDITKSDPTFSDFHSLLEDGSKRKKSKPVKKSTSSFSTLPQTITISQTASSQAGQFTEPFQQQNPPLLPVQRQDPPLLPLPGSVSVVAPAASSRESASQVKLRQRTIETYESTERQQTLMSLKGISHRQLYNNNTTSLIVTGEEIIKKKKLRARKQVLKMMPGSELTSSQSPITQSADVLTQSALQLPLSGNSLLTSSSMYVVLAPTNTGPQATVAQQASLLPINLQSQPFSIVGQNLSAAGNQFLPTTQLSLPEAPVLQPLSTSLQSTALSSTHPVQSATQLTWNLLDPQPITSTGGPQTSSSASNMDKERSLAPPVTQSSNVLMTPGKNVAAMDLEQTTALFFTGTSPAAKRKHGRKFQNTSRNLSDKTRLDSKESNTQGESRDDVKSGDVTSKWSPALKNLVNACSPVKQTPRRAPHVRHLKFSPKSVKPKKSPLRKSPAQLADSPGSTCSGLRIESPGTPADPPSDPPIHWLSRASPHLSKASPHLSMMSPQLSLMSPQTCGTSPLLNASPAHFSTHSFPTESVPRQPAASMRTPPSVGEPPYPLTPVMSSPFAYDRLCSTPIPSPLARDPTGQSPSTHDLRRSPRTKVKTAATVRPPKRIVPVARKGGSSINRVTPKKNSPSIVMAGKRGSITSITVGQSTPKGKNCIPTEISKSDLRKAVDAMLEEESIDPYTKLTSEEIVEASGIATRRDERASGSSDSESDETVGVAQALMELASSESPLKTPSKYLDLDLGDSGSRAASEASLSPCRGESSSAPQQTKRKAPPCNKQSKKRKKSPRTTLKSMNIQSMLDMIHK